MPTLLLPKHKAKTCGVTMAASESRVSELGGRRCSALWMAKAAKDAEVVLKRFGACFLFCSRDQLVYPTAGFVTLLHVMVIVCIGPVFQ